MGTPAAQTASTYQEAVRKARYGGRDWIAYHNKRGEGVFVPCTGRSVKAAMLEIGTQGHFTLIGAGNGCGMFVSWRIACNMLKQVKYGMLPA